MSGICGILLKDPRATLAHDALLPMLEALRGRDAAESGDTSSVHLGSVALAAVGRGLRLGGAARAGASDGQRALVFHGSLFGDQAPGRGPGAGAAAAAALLNGLARGGEAHLASVLGEFALAAWDGERRLLLLATDPFRVHPVYYYEDAERILFGSRLNALVAARPEPRLSIDPVSIVDVVGSSVIPTPRTIYREMRRVPPGHAVTFFDGRTEARSYWRLDFRNPSRERAPALARRLKDVFAEAVAARLAVDGPPERVGAFLSGGVDSSTVTGVLGRLAGRPVASFSIGFGESDFNEISYARIAAQALGSEHHEYFVTPGDVRDVIPVLLESFDEPFANASAVPTYFCAKLAREHGIEALYAGDGGDELFAGNERYAAQRVFRHYDRIPRWIRDPILNPLVRAAAAAAPTPLTRKAEKYVRRASLPPEVRFFSYTLFRVIPLADLLEDGLLEAVGRDYDPIAPLSRVYALAAARTELDRQLYTDLHVAISDNDLIKVTRMTEAAGVTVRFPFLDRRLAAFATTVPARLKMRGDKLRTFFKDAYADLLPAEVRGKSKHGFGLPIPVWLRTDRRLNEMMCDLVLSSRSLARGYFRERALTELLERHKTDPTSFYGATLWNLMVLELWHRSRRG